MEQSRGNRLNGGCIRLLALFLHYLSREFSCSVGLSLVGIPKSFVVSQTDPVVNQALLDMQIEQNRVDQPKRSTALTFRLRINRR
jgi:hypothetical protein